MVCETETPTTMPKIIKHPEITVVILQVILHIADLFGDLVILMFSLYQIAA